MRVGLFEDVPVSFRWTVFEELAAGRGFWVQGDGEGSLCHRRRPWTCCWWGLLLGWGAFFVPCLNLFPVLVPI